MHGAKTFTAQNNMRSPGYVNVIQWLSEAWAEFDPHIIINSFAKCGIVGDQKDDLHDSLTAVLNSWEPIRDYVEPRVNDGSADDIVAIDLLDVAVYMEIAASGDIDDSSADEME